MTLFGYGKTTQALAKRFPPCRIFDDKFTTPTTDEWGNMLLPTSDFDPHLSTLEITSPGIAPSHSLIQQAKNLISEYDFFATTMPYSIWISGTNGKTTTTEMVHHLLKKRGSDMGGNVGKPLAEMNDKAPLWVLETSSFTLHYTRKAKPNLYILLAITPDHISWHGSMEHYIADKLKPLQTLQEGEIALVPSCYANTPSRGRVIGYNGVDDLCEHFSIDKTQLRYKGVFLLDAILALCVTKILYDELDYDSLNNFVVDPHKQEEFYDSKGRLWVDDSKATNYDAAIEAIKVYGNKPLYLIVGGDDKGADLSPFFDFMKHYDIHIFAIGSNSERIATYCETFALPCHICYDLEKAVRSIDLLFNEGVGLLAPACASLDQFSGYKERGEKFQHFVKNLS